MYSCKYAPELAPPPPAADAPLPPAPEGKSMRLGLGSWGISPSSLGNEKPPPPPTPPLPRRTWEPALSPLSYSLSLSRNWCWDTRSLTSPMISGLAAASIRS